MEHPGGGEQLLTGHQIGLVKLLHTAWEVVEGEPLEVAELVVERYRKSCEDELVIGCLL